MHRTQERRRPRKGGFLTQNQAKEAAQELRDQADRSKGVAHVSGQLVTDSNYTMFLDSLRARDRSVGIVSHVPDLRRRIHAQLEVLGSRSGSASRQRGV